MKTRSKEIHARGSNDTISFHAEPPGGQTSFQASLQAILRRFAAVQRLCELMSTLAPHRIITASRCIGVAASRMVAAVAASAYGWDE
ncbi:hypothetical protein MY5147_004057 [Beauveria neobassiana]